MAYCNIQWATLYVAHHGSLLNTAERRNMKLPQIILLHF